jgi:hypothetical protein
MFGSLTSIDKLTKDIEEYMSTIITDIPQMLRSRYIDDFFGISDRVKIIMDEELNKKLPKTAPETEQLFTGMVSFAPGAEEVMGGGGSAAAGKGGEMKSSLSADEKEVIKPLQLEDVRLSLLPPSSSLDLSVALSLYIYLSALHSRRY